VQAKTALVVNKLTASVLIGRILKALLFQKSYISIEHVIFADSFCLRRRNQLVIITLGHDFVSFYRDSVGHFVLSDFFRSISSLNRMVCFHEIATQAFRLSQRVLS
jgi:hypothetical protein